MRFPDEKMCTICKETKPIENFRYHKPTGRSTRGCFSNQCAKCLNTKNLEYSKKVTNLSLSLITLIRRKLRGNRDKCIKRGQVPLKSTVKEVMDKYTTTCVICNINVGKHIKIDHCHKTGKFRGMVCHRCNILLGFLETPTNILQKARDYLRNFYQETNGVENQSR